MELLLTELLEVWMSVLKRGTQTKMEMNANLMAAQRGLALLPFLPVVLSKNIKVAAHIISEMYCKINQKSISKVFDVKCISPEYFEHLLSIDKFKVNFAGDIKSCALLSINSLALLHERSKIWLEIQKFGSESSISTVEWEKSSKMNETQNTSSERDKYFIQCYAVSSIRNEFVLYVTNELYFNIREALNVDEDGSNFKVLVDSCKYEGFPAIAEHVEIGFINSGCEVNEECLEKIVQMFFSTPRNLRENQVFLINLQKILPYLASSVGHINTRKMYFKVLSVTSKTDNVKTEFGYYILNNRTNVHISKTKSYLPREYTKFVCVKYKDCYEIPICPAGLEWYFLKIKTLFELFLNDKNMKPMVMLTGMRGSGKKTVLKCIASRLGLNLFSYDWFDFLKLDGTSLETKLYSLVSKVREMAPCIFHLHGIELIGRDENYKEDSLVLEIFKTTINGLFGSKYPVIFVGTCNQKFPDLLPSMERMFIQKVPFAPMTKNEARKLLNWLVHEAGMTCCEEVVGSTAESVIGYAFADIVKLIRIALKYQREDETLSEERRLLLTAEHMEKAMGVIESHYSDTIGAAKVPSVHWEDVGGLEKLKEEIMISLNFSKNYPQLSASGLRVSGFLFYGPPGTGKTLMAKAVATEFKYNFLAVKGPELMNMYVGQSEKNVREIFQRAREAAPCIVFFDELDSLAPNRGKKSSPVMDRIVSQLLTEMDGLESNTGVFVIGATNRPDLVDPGLLRPGRFDKMFYVGICSNAEMKLNVIKALTRRFSLDDDVDLKAVINDLPDQVTGADLYSVCSTSWMQAAHRYICKMNKGEEVVLPVTVKLKDFKMALSEFVPSLTPQVIQSYEELKSLER